MTALATELIAQIRANGPMSLADYMTTCLLHPTHGYYTTQVAFGAKGDFITAPEISQMFGELVGLALAQTWLDQGAPNAFTFAELGPGRGTLMADAWRATKAVPGFHDAAELVFFEAAPALRNVQKKALPQARHIDSIAKLPDQPLYLIANEFFDALPIRQFQRDGAGWRERRVGAQGDALVFGLTDPTPQEALSHRLEDTKDGDLVETCPAAAPILNEIGTRIGTHGGAALIIDYGDWRSLGDTFQAMENHASADPLATPGMADLTAHVDFEALAQAAPCAHTRLTPQGVWLERLGITARARALAQKLTGDALERHIAAHRRLTHPSEMGTLFKILGLYPTSGMPPAGLDT